MAYAYVDGASYVTRVYADDESCRDDARAAQDGNMMLVRCAITMMPMSAAISPRTRCAREEAAIKSKRKMAYKEMLPLQLKRPHDEPLLCRLSYADAPTMTRVYADVVILSARARHCRNTLFRRCAIVAATIRATLPMSRDAPTMTMMRLHARRRHSSTLLIYLPLPLFAAPDTPFMIYTPPFIERRTAMTTFTLPMMQQPRHYFDATPFTPVCRAIFSLSFHCFRRAIMPLPAYSRALSIHAIPRRAMPPLSHMPRFIITSPHAISLHIVAICHFSINCHTPRHHTTVILPRHYAICHAATHAGLRQLMPAYTCSLMPPFATLASSLFH